MALTEDTFDGESLGAHWTLCDCGDASRLSVTVAGGVCEVTGTSNEFIRTSPSVFDRYPVGPVQSVGLDDFDVSIRLVGTRPGSNQHAGLFFIADTTARPGKYFFFGEEGSNVVVNHYDGGTIVGGDTSVGGEYEYIRLKREDTGGSQCTVTCYGSADGTVWTQVAQYTGVALWSAFLGFCAGHRTLSASVTFSFDDFTDLSSATIDPSAQVNETAPVATESVTGSTVEGGAASATVAESAPEATESLAGGILVQTSTTETAPAAVESLAAGVVVAASTTESAPEATESLAAEQSSGTVVSETAPAATESLAGTVELTAALGEQAPEATETLAGQGIASGTVGEAAPTAQETLSASPASSGAQLTETAPDATESLSGAASAGVSTAEQAPAAQESISGGVEIVATVAESAPAAVESLTALDPNADRAPVATVTHTPGLSVSVSHVPSLPTVTHVRGLTVSVTHQAA